MKGNGAAVPGGWARYPLTVSPRPPASLLLPIRNEAENIEACLRSLDGQEYDGELEVIVAEGDSSDGSQQIINRWKGRLPVTVVDNPERLQSHGVNLAAEQARGEILIRVDAHTTYAVDYVARSVEALLESGAIAAGGPMRPEGTTPFGKAVALAMRSKLGVGPGRFHHAEEPGFVDTVYLGAFRKEDFLSVGGYRTMPSGVAEDADLYYRWRSSGEKIYLDPAIRSVYRPRQRPSDLWRQFRRYGAGKADMLYVNGRWPSSRPLAPLVLIVTLAATFVLAAATGIRWPFWSLLGLWIVALLLAARVSPQPMERLRVFYAAAIMHLAYGWGLLRGLVWRRRSRRRF